MRSMSSLRYTPVAIALPRAIAVFIAFNLSLGFLMADALPDKVYALLGSR